MVTTGLDSSALITNRDGIVGEWAPPKGHPAPLTVESPDNLELWGAAFRSQTFNFELISRLSFAQDGPEKVSVWFLDGSPGNGAQYKLLVAMTRPTEAIFKKQLEHVNGYAALRPERAGEILAQLSVASAFYGSITYLQRAPWTMELASVALRMAAQVQQRLKHALACRRPVEYSPQVQPMIPTPCHGTLPSGHATEAFTFAFVLGSVMRAAAKDGGNPVYGEVGLAEQLMRQAARLAINRQIAGMHFPVDSAAGMILGLALGQYFVGRCGAGNGWHAWTFEGSKYPLEGPQSDFDWRKLFDVESFGRTSEKLDYAPPQQAPAIEAKNSACLKWLWKKAKKEWM